MFRNSISFLSAVIASTCFAVPGSEDLAKPGAFQFCITIGGPNNSQPFTNYAFLGGLSGLKVINPSSYDDLRAQMDFFVEEKLPNAISKIGDFPVDIFNTLKPAALEHFVKLWKKNPEPSAEMSELGVSHYSVWDQNIEENAGCFITERIAYGFIEENLPLYTISARKEDVQFKIEGSGFTSSPDPDIME